MKILPKVMSLDHEYRTCNDFRLIYKFPPVSLVTLLKYNKKIRQDSMF